MNKFYRFRLMKCCKISDDQGGPLLANIGENPRYQMAPQYRGTVPFCVHISCTNWQDNTDHVQELVVCMAWYNNKSLKYCTVLYREGGNNGEAQTSHSKWFLHGWYSLSLGGKVYLNLPPAAVSYVLVIAAHNSTNRSVYCGRKQKVHAISAFHFFWTFMVLEQF